MTSTTSGTDTDNGGHGFHPRPARVDVPVVSSATAPATWQPALRLIAQLAEIFPDQVLDIDEPHLEEEPPSQLEQS